MARTTTSAYKEAQAEKFAQKKTQSTSSGGSSSSTRTTTKKSSSSSEPYTYGPSQKDLEIAAEEERQRKIAEYKAIKEGIEKANSDLTFTGQGLIGVLELLKDSFSGEKSNTIMKRVGNIVEKVNESGKKLNETYNTIVNKLKELGETTTQSNLFKSADTSVKTTNKDSSYKWNAADGYKVINGVIIACDYIGKTVETIKNIPKNINDGIEKIIDDLVDTQNDTKKTNQEIENANKAAEDMERKNKEVVDRLIANTRKILESKEKPNVESTTSAYEEGQAEKFAQKKLETAEKIKAAEEEDFSKDWEEFLKELEEVYPEIPLFNQKDSEWIKNGASISADGCGLVAYSMVLTYLLDNYVGAAELAEKYLGKYFFGGTAGGTNPDIFKETESEYGINVDRCEWEEAWLDGKVMEALRNGQPIIVQFGEGDFTGTRHYVVLDGIVEYVNENGEIEERIVIKDPNGENYGSENSRLQDGFANGFKPEVLSQGGYGAAVYFIFDSKETVQENIKKAENYEGAEVTNTPEANSGNSNENEEIKQVEIDTNISEPLTAEMGLNRNGPSGTETWYDSDMNQVVKNMEEVYGYSDLEMKVREDGVKTLSGTTPSGETFEDLVMVAADVNHMSNPDGTFERGEIVQTSLGTGIVVDLCQRSVDERKEDGNVHFDIATTWGEEY